MAGATAAMPWLIPATELAVNGRTAPSDRITIDFGGRCRDVRSAFISEDDVQCLAVADYFADHWQADGQS